MSYGGFAIYLDKPDQNYPMLIDRELKLKDAFYDVIELV